MHPPEIPSKTRFSFHALCEFGKFFKSSKIVLRFGFGGRISSIPLGRPRRLSVEIWIYDFDFGKVTLLPRWWFQVPRWCLCWCPDWCSGAQVGRPPPQYIPKSSALPAYTACSFALVVAAVLSSTQVQQSGSAGDSASHPSVLHWSGAPGQRLVTPNQPAETDFHISLLFLQKLSISCTRKYKAMLGHSDQTESHFKCSEEWQTLNPIFPRRVSGHTGR